MKSKLNEAFEDWWNRVGQYYDPDFSDVPWFDKRKFLAEIAFDAATGQSRNYVADEAINPTQVNFANGRIVKLAGQFLTVT